MILDPEVLAKWHQFKPGPEEIIHPEWASHAISVKRLDKISSWASGNKYYKLKYNLLAALQGERKAVISKGGMFSNHLEALAGACAYFAIPCICIIRSYAPDENNPTIKKLRQLNAQIRYTAPVEFEKFDERAAYELERDALFIPEGGANEAGFLGAREIFHELQNNYTHIILAGGTLSTAAAVIAEAGHSTRVILVPAWKGCTLEYLKTTLNQFRVKPNCEIEVWPGYHFGGFGKFNLRLFSFMLEFTSHTGILLDPVYNSKLMFAIRDKMELGYFSKDDRILVLHTGGLQGLDGAYYRSPEMWKEYIHLAKALS